MKKIIKVVSIIVIVSAIIVALIFLGVGKEKEEDKKDPITLSQECNDSDFYARNIECDLLEEKEILYYDGEILILDDYTMYETAFNSDKVYSNNQRYKQIDLGVQVKRIHVMKESPS